MKTKDITMIGIMAALMCVAGPLSVPIGPVPVSLATFAVYLAGALLGWKRGPLAVAIYLLIGIVGIPVFAGFSGGFGRVAGVTGGYLVGYLPCAMITGLGAFNASDSADRPLWRLPLCMVAGTAALYALGTAWFMAQTGNSLAASMGMCVIPFLPGDAAKIAAATLVATPVRRAVYR